MQKKKAKKEIKPLPQGKDNAARAKCEDLGVTIASTKRVEYPGRDPQDLITVTLPDGSTLTVDANNPEHPNVIEHATNRVKNQIAAGKRPPKKDAPA